MSSKVAAVAEAVKTALNLAPDGTFSQTFTAVRKYLPAADLQDLKDWQVTVVARSGEYSKLSRSANQRDVQIDVGLQKKIATTTNPATAGGNPELDAFLQFAEEVADFFKPGAYGPGLWLGTKHEPLVDPDHLLTQRVFTSLITLTFKVF